MRTSIGVAASRMVPRLLASMVPARILVEAASGALNRVGRFASVPYRLTGSAVAYGASPPLGCEAGLRRTEERDSFRLR